MSVSMEAAEVRYWLVRLIKDRHCRTRGNGKCARESQLANPAVIEEYCGPCFDFADSWIDRRAELNVSDEAPVNACVLFSLTARGEVDNRTHSVSEV